MEIHLSDHFNYSRLLRFAAPSIAGMLFLSLYSVVDGIFVSNVAGKTPFAAINFIAPVISVLAAPSMMLGAGGSAVVGRLLGERREERANAVFSLLFWTVTVLGVILGGAGILFLRPIASMLGATGALLEDSIRYGRILLAVQPFQMLEMFFSSLFVTAERPDLGFDVIFLSGMANILLDTLFVLGFRLGLTGAAVATALSQALGGVIGILCFLRPRRSLLRITRWRGESPRILIQVCLNGSSEMVDNVASSVVGMLYNVQLMRFAGEDGVAAFGAIMYVSFLFSGIFFGFSSGCAPLVSYQEGAGNLRELRNLFGRCITVMGASGGIMFLLVLVGAAPLSALFTRSDPALYRMTVEGFRIFALSFLVEGITVFSSSFFTALGNGLVSAAIAFLRTFVFQVLAIVLLPALFQLKGIWWSTVVAEAASFLVSLAFLAWGRKRYGYA